MADGDCTNGARASRRQHRRSEGQRHRGGADGKALTLEAASRQSGRTTCTSASITTRRTRKRQTPTLLNLSLR